MNSCCRELKQRHKISPNTNGGSFMSSIFQNVSAMNSAPGKKRLLSEKKIRHFFQPESPAFSGIRKVFSTGSFLDRMRKATADSELSAEFSWTGTVLHVERKNLSRSRWNFFQGLAYSSCSLFHTLIPEKIHACLFQHKPPSYSCPV